MGEVPSTRESGGGHGAPSSDPYSFGSDHRTWLYETRMAFMAGLNERRSHAVITGVVDSGPGRFVSLEEVERRYAALPIDHPDHQDITERLARLYVALACRALEPPEPVRCKRCGLPLELGDHGFGHCADRGTRVLR